MYIIITNHNNGTLYIEVTSDLIKRINQHKLKTYQGFSAKYGLDQLVYYEEYSEISEAIYGEKQLKGLLRKKKIDLIVKDNPQWLDLAEDRE